jgi:integrase
MEDWSLRDSTGARKYITAEERKRFLAAIPRVFPKKADHYKQSYAKLLFYSGCRVSEGLGIQYGHVDLDQNIIVIETLKRRKKSRRIVPVPEHFIMALDLTHGIRDVHTKPHMRDQLLWSMSRATASRVIAAIMKEADITGIHATPKGLRHSFVLSHMEKRTPPVVIQKLVGWASTDMLRVYGDAVGSELREMAGAIWE